jgi:hypothetical protein
MMRVCCPYISDLLTNISATGACSIEFFLASKDPFRVAPGNKIPCTWRYEIHRASNQAQELLKSLENEYKKVLQISNIQLHYTRVLALCPKGFDDPPQDTLLIVSKDLDTSHWKVAATEIQEIINRATVKVNRDLSIQVEIRNEELMYQDVHHVIRPGTVEQSACREIEDAVLDQVRKSCDGAWTTIGFWMRGQRDQTEGLKLTIIICIKQHTKGLWSMVEDEIAEALQPFQSNDVDIHIELLPGRPVSIYNWV